jgi:hypothetical protein
VPLHLTANNRIDILAIRHQRECGFIDRALCTDRRSIIFPIKNTVKRTMHVDYACG